LPKVVARRCLEQDLNPRPTDHKSNALPLHHRVSLVMQNQVFNLVHKVAYTQLSFRYISCRFYCSRLCCTLARNVDAFDQSCLRCILCISWRANEEVRRRTYQLPLTHIIRTTCIKFFGHIARADPSMDHSRAPRTCVTPLPRDWNHRSV